MAASTDRKVPYMENKSPDKIKYDKVRDEFVQYINDVKKDPKQIEHVDSMLEKIYKFSIEHKHKENNQTAQEILEKIRGKKDESTAIFPEDLHSSFVDGVDEGKRLGREAIKSVSRLFDSNDWYSDLNDVDRGER